MKRLFKALGKTGHGRALLAGRGGRIGPVAGWNPARGQLHNMV